MAAHNELGKWGEEMAAEYLQQKGYRIIERDWRSGNRDIDIIAQAPDPSTLVFVEVKTRKSEALMRAADAVNPTKARNISLSANNYVKMCHVDALLRFDIITIVGTNAQNMKLEHIIDAFNPMQLF